MNEMTKKYIESLPESARDWARRVASGVPAWNCPATLPGNEAAAIQAAIKELAEFDEKPKKMEPAGRPAKIMINPTTKIDLWCVAGEWKQWADMTPQEQAHKMLVKNQIAEIAGEPLPFPHKDRQ